MSISACIIVRDGGDLFREMLLSITGIVDEIIVVNTDPDELITDDLMLAQTCGARCFHHPWEGDFSLHRNQAIGHVTGGDWILIIDADETVDGTVERATLNRWLSSLPDTTGAAAIRLWDMRQGRSFMLHHQVRLFRKGCIRYEGSVHNQPRITGQVEFCPIMTMRHYGYDLPEDQMERKYLRQERMLLDAIEAQPGNYQLLFYLSQHYGLSGCADKAIECSRAYIEHREEMGDRFFFTAYTSLASILISLKRYDEAAEIIRAGLADKPGADLYYCLSTYAVEQKIVSLIIQAVESYHEAVAALDANQGIDLSTFHFFVAPHHRMTQKYRLAMAHIVIGKLGLDEIWDRLPRQISDQVRSNLDALGLRMKGDESILTIADAQKMVRECISEPPAWRLPPISQDVIRAVTNSTL
jgi:hypothetical protein